MNHLKRALGVIGVLAIVAMTASLLAPRTTHALVAALVEVTNTPANPVPNRDVDNPARNAIRLKAQVSIGPGGNPFGSAGLGTFGLFPPGSRVVIEFFGASCRATAAPGVDVETVSLLTSEANGEAHGATFVPQKTGSPNGAVDIEYVVAQPLRLYADGTSPGFLGEVIVLATNTLPPGGLMNCNFEVSGYAVNLQ
jgi:hypothetical protein